MLDRSIDEYSDEPRNNLIPGTSACGLVPAASKTEWSTTARTKLLGVLGFEKSTIARTTAVLALGAHVGPFLKARSDPLEALNASLHFVSCVSWHV